jgi:CPA2 family monovalent cation:H+ antiporter-2
LSQIGEFSFVLAASGESYGLFNEDLYQLFLAVSVLTMASAPILLSLAPQLANYALRMPIPEALRHGQTEPVVHHEVHDPSKLENHIVIIGYGVNGRNIARAARAANITYTIIEMNPETVREERKKGVPVVYGDATYEAVLEHAKVASARTIAVVINDPIATRRIIQLARSMNRYAYVIVRTRFIREIEALRKLGASEVVPEEFETSVEIFSRILAHYLVPQDDIERFITEVRRDEYGMFRTMNSSNATVWDLVVDLPALEISAFQVEDGASVVNRTLAEIDLRRHYGVTLLEIRRGAESFANPSGDEQILAGDVLVVMGEMEARKKFAEECLKRNMNYEI